MKIRSELRESALRYREKYGFSVIPIRRNKKPLIEWQKYQKSLPSPDEISLWWTKWPDANVGIVTGKLSDLAVIDVDTEQGKEAISEYIPDSCEFPVCETPGGGQHFYFCYPEDKKIGNNTRRVPGCDLRAEGGYVIAPPSRGENGKYYQWHNLLTINKVEIRPLPAAYVKYININSTIRGCNNSAKEMFVPGRRDNDLFHTANCLEKGGMPASEAHHVLTVLARSCILPEEKDNPEKWARQKVESAMKRSERKEVNVTQEVAKWVAVTKGYFAVTNCYNELQLVTKQQKNAARVAICRLVEKGVLERHRQRDAVYRRIEVECEEIDWKSAPTQDLDIDWPLGLSALARIYPGNIVVVAGVQNCGKTAFMLNFIKQNMHNNQIHYFNSEMGATELKLRLQKFEDVSLDDWKMSVWERSGNFADVIKPDAVNVIDFLEIHKDFWEVGAMLKDIHNRLKKGIAVVALQKSKEKEVGRGGDMSLEKSRLYLAMDPGIITIVKCKNWQGERNPNGLSKRFRLVQGWKFIEGSQWEERTV